MRMKKPTKAKKKSEKRCKRVMNSELIQNEFLKGSFNDDILIRDLGNHCVNSFNPPCFRLHLYQVPKLIGSGKIGSQQKSAAGVKMKIKNPKNRLDLSIKRSDRVLEIGGGNNPHPRSNVVVDKFPDINYHRSGDIKVLKHQTFIQADGEDLPFKDKDLTTLFAARF